MNTTLVLDSSVIAKWFFPEENSEKALEIKGMFTDNSISIAIPILLYYEINNIVRTAIKLLPISKAEGLHVYKEFLQLNFVTYSSELLMEKTLAFALQYDISSYDASYVALAEYLHIPLVTADQKLLNKVSREFVLDIQDYGKT